MDVSSRTSTRTSAPRKPTDVAAQWPMRIVAAGRSTAMVFVPPDEELAFQISVGLFQRFCPGHAQTLDQTIPGRPESCVPREPIP